jgi:hypothetical protein
MYAASVECSLQTAFVVGSRNLLKAVVTSFMSSAMQQEHSDQMFEFAILVLDLHVEAEENGSY